MPLIFIAKNSFMFEVRAETFPIGALSMVRQPSAGAGGPIEYRWFLSISAAPAGFKRDGHAYSLDDAKAAMEASWQTWLTAAGLTEKTQNAPDVS
jgi:hypothetical protein